MSTAPYRSVPPGFTEAQWDIFDRDGIISIEDAIDLSLIHI